MVDGSLDFRWQHYLEQYLLLKQSLSKEKLLESEFDEKVQQFLEMGISWNDVSSYILYTNEIHCFFNC